MMSIQAYRKDVYGHLEQLTQPDGFLGDAALSNGMCHR
jgi:hypothetical protein